MVQSKKSNLGWKYETKFHKKAILISSIKQYTSEIATLYKSSMAKLALTFSNNLSINKNVDHKEKHQNITAHGCAAV